MRFHHNIFLLLLLTTTGLHAQMSFHDHVHVTTQGYPSIVVQNADIDAGDADLSGQLAVWVIRNIFGPYYIDAATPLPFDRVRLEGEDTEVLLGQYITLGHELDFAGGRIDLMDQIMMIEPGAVLVNEDDYSYGTASNGGFFWMTTFLSYPDGEEPGGLGLTITSDADLSLTQFRRGHSSLATPGGPSIERWYQMKPANNSEVGAKLVFEYREGELNGYDPEDLVVWKTTNGGLHWEMLLEVDHEPDANLVVFAEPDELAMYTLAPPAENMAMNSNDLGDADRRLEGKTFHTRLQVYPNPVHDQLSLQIESDQDRELELRLLDARGRLIRTYSATAVQGTNQTTFSFTEYPAGTYWLQANDESILPVAVVKQ